MAWVTEYDATWRSGNATGDIFLQRDEGSYQFPLVIERNSLEIATELPNWESHVVRQNCSFTIRNNRDDWFDFIPLMTISNGQIRVVVTFDDASSNIPDIFVGYLNCETIQHNMYAKAPLTLTASGLLKKLEGDHPTSIDTLQNMSLIDILDDCLTMTGSAFNIRVNCSLYELNTSLASGETLFNKTGIFTELFWKNNVDRLSGLDILEAILHDFQCYLYWFQDYWYIEHYQDMGTPTSKTFVEYTTGQSYEDGEAGSNQVVSLGSVPDVHDPMNRPQVWPTQVLAVDPGMKIVEIRLDQQEYFNLINGDLSDITFNTDILPLPAKREWEGYEDVNMDWVGQGNPWQDIANSIFRRGSSGAVNGYGNGITTSFKMTTQEDTSLVLTFKAGIHVLSDLPGTSEDPADYTFTFHWWLNVIVDGMPSAYFIIYNESAGTWAYTISTVAGALQSTEVDGGDFDPIIRTAEVSITIPIGEIFASSSGATEDMLVIFGIGTEQVDDGVISPQAMPYMHFGDVSASMSETPDDNILTGRHNTDFLDKKTINMIMFDSGWSYRNTLLRGNNFQYRATDWGYDSMADSLSRWMMANKFRLYNVARQKISTDYVLASPLRPLQLWYDNKQSDKTFILTKDIYKPESDIHSVTLREYDNTTEINLT